MTVAIIVGLVVGLILGGAANLLIQRAPKRLPLFRQMGQTWRGRLPVAVCLVLALLVAAVAWRFGLSVALAVRALYAMLLITLLVIDWQHHLIPNVIIYPAMALAIAAAPLAKGPGLVDAGIGGLIGGGLFFALFMLGLIVFHQEALGFGDVRLAFFLGLAAGYPSVLTVLLVGIIVAGVASVALLIARRGGRKTFIPYGAFLCLAALPFLLLLEN